jgi:hypothetical protein
MTGAAVTCLGRDGDTQTPEVPWRSKKRLRKHDSRKAFPAPQFTNCRDSQSNRGY